ncbi:MAG: response regulator [Nitrospirae bacterium]|nr:MAG: response regulator [Nitrospirota bacterium]
MTDAKILIVEDEAIEAMDIQQRLADMGYPLPDIAHSGEEGVRKVEALQPDLILMDIMMPGKMDGVAAAEQIRSRFDIPIIFLTAYADDNTLSRAKITAPYGYIVKPFQERELHITVDMALYRHKMEKELKESKKWYSTTLRSIGDAVIATDKKGLITFMNPVAEGLTGWKMKNALNKEMAEVFNIMNMDTRQAVENPVLRVIREGVTVGLANHTILIAREGKEIPIDDSAAPIKDDKGNIMGVVLVFRDITEREKMEEALKQSQAEVQTVNRDLEVYSYTISHELKAPLRSIEGFSKAILEDYANKLDATGKDFCKRIVAASKRMSQQIDSLLTMSRLTQGELRENTVNLSDMAEVIAYELKKSQPERSAEFVIAKKIKIHGDFDLLRIVMENLLANAWKFTGKRKAAKIEFGQIQSKPPLNPLLNQGGELVDSENSPPKLGGVAKGRGGETVYFVRDNGAGFDMKYADKLFMPFQRLHSENEFSGLGVGLATVYKIITKHGGKIWAESEMGKGTTVYFTLGQTTPAPP